MKAVECLEMQIGKASSCSFSFYLHVLSQYHISLSEIDFIMHLTIQQLYHVALYNIGKYLPCFSHMFLLFHSPKSSRNKLQNMWNSVNVSYITRSALQQQVCKNVMSSLKAINQLLTTHALIIYIKCRRSQSWISYIFGDLF